MIQLTVKKKTMAIPESDISEYRVKVNGTVEHTFAPDGTLQTVQTGVAVASGDTAQLVAADSEGNEFISDPPATIAWRPNITRFEQIGSAVEGGDVTVEADVTLVADSIDRVEVAYNGGVYQMIETATAGTWVAEIPVSSGTHDAVCTAFEDSPQGLASPSSTISIVSEEWTLVHDFDMAGATLPLADTVASNSLAADGTGTGEPVLGFVQSGGNFDGQTGVEITVESQGFIASSMDAAAFPSGIMLQFDVTQENDIAHNAQIWRGLLSNRFRTIKRKPGVWPQLVLSYRNEAGTSPLEADLVNIGGDGSRIRLIFLPSGEVKRQTWDFGEAQWNATVDIVTVDNPSGFYDEVIERIHRGPRLDGGSGDPGDWIRFFDYKIWSKNA